jgi:ABC-2 type transport system ATP-binding protein
VQKRFAQTVALSGLDLDLAEGQVLGLLGPNGAGKSTLLRILMDIIRADAGTIKLFGKACTRAALDHVAYLPEERGLYRKHKVLDVLVYFAALKGVERRTARHRALEWLERFRLSHVASFRVEQLSKGMSQKVQLAATLVSEPTLFVLDEPFSGLDPVNLRLVRDLIREQRAQGRAVILSTHQMNEVEELCDRVALIHRGDLLVDATVAELRRLYALPEVQVRSVAPLPELAHVSARRIAEQEWRLTLAPEQSPSSVLCELVAQGARIDRFFPVLPSLEDIFVRLVEPQPERRES